MHIAHIVLLAGAFAVAFCTILAILVALRPGILQRRLGQIDRELPHLAPQNPEHDWLRTVERLAKPLAKVSVPREGWEDSNLRTRFVHAGWRSPEAIPIYFGIKTVLLIAVPMLLFGLLIGHFNESQRLIFLAILFVGAVIGFYTPNLVLALKIKYRQRDIFESFPDSLDLIMVCVEAGLGLDAAILRVVDEMRAARPVMAQEYELLTLELRAGLSREKALRNFAARTGVEDVSLLVAMLIQADRFGTSIAASLRVHSDMLRTKRQMLAEERAAKVGTKVLFPLIFFIFPSIYVVLLGSALIRIVEALQMIGNQ